MTATDLRPESETGTFGTANPKPARRSIWRRHRERVRLRKARRHARRYFFGRHPFATAALVVIVGFTPVWWSLGNALTDPGMGTSVAARFAEWMRDNGMRSIVVTVENWWYEHHQPTKGGAPPAGAIPPPILGPRKHVTTVGHPGVASQTNTLAGGLVPLPTPAPLKTVITPAIAGEGQWHPIGRRVDGVPAMYDAFLRSDSAYSSLVSGVVWMDMRLLRATLYSGSFIPGGGPFRYTAPIEPAAAKTLVALFNSGFRMQDTNGGYYTDGRLLYAMRDGSASFVIYKNGSVNIGAWGSEVRMTPQVAQVRQNVNMLVDHGQEAPGLNSNDTTQWGFTLGNQIFVPRAGVGITADGALVFVAGDLNITDLARLLVRAGAVRAMELDINPGWVEFASYAPSQPNGLASPSNGTNLLPSIMPSDGPSREFQSWWQRDFFTISAR
jgi:hypothetical protein